MFPNGLIHSFHTNFPLSLIMLIMLNFNIFYLHPSVLDLPVSSRSNDSSMLSPMCVIACTTYYTFTQIWYMHIIPFLCIYSNMVSYCHPLFANFPSLKIAQCQKYYALTFLISFQIICLSFSLTTLYFP